MEACGHDSATATATTAASLQDAASSPRAGHELSTQPCCAAPRVVQVNHATPLARTRFERSCIRACARETKLDTTAKAELGVAYLVMRPLSFTLHGGYQQCS